jgi:uncharacterized protein
MRLTEVTYDNAAPVDGYGPGFFRIAGDVVQGHILLLPNQTLAWGGTDDHETILNAANDIDVLFIGTGPEIAHIPDEMRAKLDAAGIGVELMSTPTACRTYNVLLSEGRRIGAALLAV